MLKFIYPSHVIAYERANDRYQKFARSDAPHAHWPIFLHPQPRKTNWYHAEFFDNIPGVRFRVLVSFFDPIIEIYQ